MATGSTDASSLQRIHERVAATSNDELPKVLDKLLPRLLPMLNNDNLRDHVLPLVSHIMKRVKELKCPLPIAAMLRSCIAPSSFCCNVAISFINIALPFESVERLPDCALALLDALSSQSDHFSKALSPLLYYSLQLLPYITVTLSPAHSTLLAGYYIDVTLLQPGMISQGVGSVRPGLTTQRLARLQHLINTLTPVSLSQCKMVILNHANKLRLPDAVLLYCLLAVEGNSDIANEANYKLKHLHANQKQHDTQTLVDTVHYTFQACSVGIPSTLTTGGITTECAVTNESLQDRTAFSEEVIAYILHWAHKDFSVFIDSCLSICLHMLHYHFLFDKSSKTIQLLLLKIANTFAAQHVTSQALNVFHMSALAGLQSYVGMTSRSNELDRDSLIRKESYVLLDALFHLPIPCSFDHSTVSLLFNLLDLEDGVGHGARVTEGYRLLGRLKDIIISSWNQDEISDLLQALVSYSRASATISSKQRMAVQWCLALFPFTEESIDLIVLLADDNDALISTTVNNSLKALQAKYLNRDWMNICTQRVYARFVYHAHRLETTGEHRNVYASVLYTLTLILHSMHECSCAALHGNSSGKHLYDLFVRQYTYASADSCGDFAPELIDSTLSLVHNHLQHSTKVLLTSVVLLYRHIAMYASAGHVALKEITIALLSLIDSDSLDELPYCIGYACIPDNSFSTSIDVESRVLSGLGISINDHEGFVAHVWRILMHKHQHPTNLASSACALRCMSQVVIAVQNTSLFEHYQTQFMRCIKELLEQPSDCTITAIRILFILLKCSLIQEADISHVFEALVALHSDKVYRNITLRTFSQLAIAVPRLHEKCLKLIWANAKEHAAGLHCVAGNGNSGGVEVNDAVEIQYQLSLADAMILGLTRNKELTDDSLLNILNEIHQFSKTAPTFLALLLLRLQPYSASVSPKKLLFFSEIVIDVMRCGGEKSGVRRNICCACLCGVYNQLSNSTESFDTQFSLAEMVIAALTRQTPTVAQRAPGMSEEPNVVNVSEMIQSITAAAAPTTTFAAPSDANETVGVYTTICSIAKKSQNLSVLFPLLSAVQPHVRPSVSQSLAKDTSIASQTSTRDGEHSQHWSDMEGFDFICDYWYPGKLKLLPHHSIPQLIPLLYTARFHPNASIKQIMRDVWNQLVPNSQATLTEYGSVILKHLVSNINNKDWKYRECCCAGIEAMLPHKNKWADVSFCVEELWRAGIEVVADVRDSVKMAGAAMMKALADLITRTIDVSLSPHPEEIRAAMDMMLPLILRGVEGSGPEARGISLGLLLRIIKLRQHTTGVITLLVESMSALEPRTLQYMQFHINKMSISEQEFEEKRLQLSRSTPMQEALDDCLQILTHLTIVSTVHSLTHLAQTGVGVATRSAALRSLLTISHTYTAPASSVLKEESCSPSETSLPTSEVHFIVQSLLNSIWRTTNAALQSDHLAVIGALMPRCQVEFVLLLCRQLLAFHDTEDSDALLMAQLIAIMVNKCGDHIIDDECVSALIVMAYCGGFTESKGEGSIVEDSSVPIWRKVFSDILSIASFDKTAALRNNLIPILNRVQRLLKHLSYVARCNGMSIIKDLYSTLGPYWMGKERVFETLVLFKDCVQNVEGVLRLQNDGASVIVHEEHLQSKSVVLSMLNTEEQWSQWCFGINELLRIYILESQKGDEQYRIGIAKCINRLPISILSSNDKVKHISTCLEIVGVTHASSEPVAMSNPKPVVETKPALKMDVFGSRYGTNYASVPRKVKQRSLESQSNVDMFGQTAKPEIATSSAAYRVQIIEVVAKLWPTDHVVGVVSREVMLELQSSILAYMQSQTSNTVWSIRKACFSLLSKLCATMHLFENHNSDEVEKILQIITEGVNDSKYSQIRGTALAALRCLMSAENRNILVAHKERIQNILKLARSENDSNVLAEFANNAEQLRLIF